jgi:signal transduction histidine kinase
VRVDVTETRLEVEVSDDGIGGAAVGSGGGLVPGSGLRGLEDRLGALDGHLVVESPDGGGTRLLATIPLGDGAPA